MHLGAPKTPVRRWRRCRFRLLAVVSPPSLGAPARDDVRTPRTGSSSAAASPGRSDSPHDRVGDASSSSVAKAGGASEAPASRAQCGSGRTDVAGSAPSRREWTAQMMCRSRGRARLRSECFYLGRPARAARPRLARGASCLADERARRKRARSVADAAPNARRSAGPSDPIVSSTGMPAMCANEITGRSPWYSRRPGGAPRGRGRDRRGGRRSRRRSRGRPASHRRASS
jgi:hypothetical protein